MRDNQCADIDTNRGRHSSRMPYGKKLHLMLDNYLRKPMPEEISEQHSHGTQRGNSINAGKFGNRRNDATKTSKQ